MPTAAAVDDPRAHHRRRLRAAVALVAATTGVGPMIAILLVGWVTGQVVLGLVGGLLVGAAAAAATVVPAWRDAEGRILRTVRAVPADPVAHVRLANLVDGLVAAGGMPPPTLFVVEDDEPNALACGRDARRSCLAVTTGLLTRLDRMQLEGVVGRELCLLGSGAMWRPTFAAALAEGPLGAIFAGLIEGGVGQAEVSAADLAGVGLTRYPPGLAAALAAIGDGVRDELRARAPAGAPLWLVPPDGWGRPLQARVEALAEL